MFAKFPRKSLLVGTAMPPRHLGLFNLNAATKIVIFLDSCAIMLIFFKKSFFFLSFLNEILLIPCYFLDF